MRELRCPSCGWSNALLEGMDLEDTRCAACQSTLDETREVRYFVAVGRRVRGPVPYSQIREEVATAALHPIARLSEEGGPWQLAEEREDLFPRARRLAAPGAVPWALPRSRPPPAAAAHHRQRKAPAYVVTMSVLDYVVGTVFLLLALLAGIFFGNEGLSEGAWAFLVFLALGGGHIALGVLLVRGSQAAQVVQLCLAGLAGVGLVSVLGQAGVGGGALLGILIAAPPFVLLLSREARAFFGGGPPPAG